MKDRLLLRRSVSTRAERCRWTTRAVIRRFDRVHPLVRDRPRRAWAGRRPDGVTWNAVYSTETCCASFPPPCARSGPLAPDVILTLAASSYRVARRAKLTPLRSRQAREFQSAYLALVRRAARLTKRTREGLLTGIAARSAVVNAYARVTGDAISHASMHLACRYDALGPDALYEVVDRFAELRTSPGRPDAKRVFDRCSRSRSRPRRTLTEKGTLPMRHSLLGHARARTSPARSPAESRAQRKNASDSEGPARE